MHILTFRRRSPAEHAHGTEHTHGAEHTHEHPGVRVQATWNGTVLADSDRTIVIEGNHYFPPEDVSTEYLSESSRNSTCPWKGEASYYDVVVDGECNEAAAWYYPEPSEAAAEIRDHVAFWAGVDTRAV